MLRAYQFALDPTPQQEESFRSHCGATRVAYNWCLARVLANWSQRSAEESYGIPDDARTPWVDTSAYGLRRDWNATKDAVAPWWRENSKETYAAGCAQLASALRNRKAGRGRTPRFKTRRNTRLSCRFTTGTFGLVQDRRHIQLPRIGVVRTHESTRKLARKIERGVARVLSATLSYQRGRWHVSFGVELPEPVQACTSTQIVGVDLGISTLATLSTGERVDNPRHFGAALRKLRRVQRRCARRRRADSEPSNRYLKAQARAEQIYINVTNLRRNSSHRFTSALVRDFDTIVIEDLHVTGMMRNRRLARHIQDASWGEIRRQLAYKTETAGKRLIVADRWFASSKTCSGCGAVKAKLMLSERTYVCTACGIVLDRDENAARNLAALAVDTGELRREQPDRTNVRRAGTGAVGSLREEPKAQRHRRKAVAR